jgi:hypothetical protein
MITFNDSSTIVNHVGLFLEAEGFMDTVSMIRGNIGRPALKEEDRIVFMKKRVTISDGGKINSGQGIPFDFILEANTGKE